MSSGSNLTLHYNFGISFINLYQGFVTLFNTFISLDRTKLIFLALRNTLVRKSQTSIIYYNCKLTKCYNTFIPIKFDLVYLNSHLKSNNLKFLLLWYLFKIYYNLQLASVVYKLMIIRYSECLKSELIRLSDIPDFRHCLKSGHPIVWKPDA